MANRKRSNDNHMITLKNVFNNHYNSIIQFSIFVLTQSTTPLIQGQIW